ncbi:MAG: hypothetical protein ACYC99_16615 [Candidatus Geothermincolia bacterium]
MVFFTYTEASQKALIGLRDLHMLKWYVVPMILVVAYILTKEIKDSRGTGNWDPILAVLVLFGCDFFNETWNGWVFHLSNRSAVWTTPGPTGLRVFVGWNIEIILAFIIFGLVYYHSLLPDKKRRILGVPNRWFYAILFALMAVIIEVALNVGGHLVWEYSWWKFTIGGIWLIFFIGYFYWFVAIILMLNMKSMKNKLIFIGAIYAVPIIMNVLALGILGWRY